MIQSIWFDITNTPQVHFLLAVKKMLNEKFSNFTFTARDFSETKDLLSKYVDKTELKIINSTYGRTKLEKIKSVFSRYYYLRSLDLNFDLSLSCGSDAAIWYSSFSRKRSIAFGDNDTAKQWTYSRFVDFAFFPDAIDAGTLNRQGLKKKFYRYSGYKEDIYISYYKPDKIFKNNIPFENYVVIRPENIHANYLKNSSVISIVPSLLAQLSGKGYNIVFLPRYQEDRKYSDGISNIYIPENPLNGLDLCYYADAVLTGAGTFAREAACLGIPAFSFYAGKELLAVDKKLIEDGKIYFSRNVSDLVEKVIKSSKNEPDFSRSIVVREELKEMLINVIDSFDSKRKIAYT
jgi:predicted glycosyltransferase